MQTWLVVLVLGAARLRVVGGRLKQETRNLFSPIFTYLILVFRLNVF